MYLGGKAMCSSRAMLVSCGMMLSAFPILAQEIVLRSAVIAGGGVSHARETQTNHVLSSTVGQAVISRHVQQEGLNRYEGFWVPWPAAIVSVDETEDVFALRAFPNPFSTSTRIEIADDVVSDVEIALYTLAGMRVRSMYQVQLVDGQRSIELTSNDDNDVPLSSGQYICMVAGRNQAGAQVRAYTTVTILK